MDNPGNTPSDKKPESPQLARLSRGEWVMIVCLALFLFGFGINVLVTHKASAGRGFRGGPVTLDPISAWYLGLALIFGAVVLPLGYAAMKQKRQKQQARQGHRGGRGASSQGMSHEEAESRVAEERRQKQEAVRKEGRRMVQIGGAMMVAGFVWAIVAIFVSHNILLIMLGVGVGVIGKFQFFGRGWEG